MTHHLHDALLCSCGSDNFYKRLRQLCFRERFDGDQQSQRGCQSWNADSEQLCDGQRIHGWSGCAPLCTRLESTMPEYSRPVTAPYPAIMQWEMTKESCDDRCDLPSVGWKVSRCFSQNRVTRRLLLCPIGDATAFQGKAPR
jgi:hypothetical protein